MAVEAVLAGRNVMFYSLEMSAIQMQVRMHVLLGRRLGVPVDHAAMRDKIYDKHNYRKLIETLQSNVSGKLLIADSSIAKVSPIHVASTAKDHDIVFVDYAGLMHSGTGGRAVDDWRAMASISNQLKEVAISTKTRIIAAAQINRSGDSGQVTTKDWRPPNTKYLSQSDALGQDADVVITQRLYGKTAVVYSLEKNRHGASGNVWFSEFDPNHGKFNEIPKAKADQLREDSMDDD
jgi:replicative DNA helicase